MALSGNLEVDVEVKSAPQKFWTAIQESDKLLPKVVPHQFKSIEILEGDGKSVGSVRLLTYAEGVPILKVSKEKIDIVDEAKRAASYSVIDGELLGFYKSFKAHLEVAPKGEGSLVIWSCEFEKIEEQTPDPTLFREIAIKTFKELDEYLLKAN